MTYQSLEIFSSIKMKYDEVLYICHLPMIIINSCTCCPNNIIHKLQHRLQNENSKVVENISDSDKYHVEIPDYLE